MCRLFFLLFFCIDNALIYGLFSTDLVLKVFQDICSNLLACERIGFLSETLSILVLTCSLQKCRESKHEHENHKEIKIDWDIKKKKKKKKKREKKYPYTQTLYPATHPPLNMTGSYPHYPLHH